MFRNHSLKKLEAKWILQLSSICDRGQHLPCYTVRTFLPNLVLRPTPTYLYLEELLSFLTHYICTFHCVSRVHYFPISIRGLLYFYFPIVVIVWPCCCFLYAVTRVKMLPVFCAHTSAFQISWAEETQAVSGPLACAATVSYLRVTATLH